MWKTLIHFLKIATYWLIVCFFLMEGFIVLTRHFNTDIFIIFLQISRCEVSNAGVDECFHLERVPRPVLALTISQVTHSLPCVFLVSVYGTVMGVGVRRGMGAGVGRGMGAGVGRG